MARKPVVLTDIDHQESGSSSAEHWVARRLNSLAQRLKRDGMSDDKLKNVGSLGWLLIKYSAKLGKALLPSPVRLAVSLAGYGKDAVNSCIKGKEVFKGKSDPVTVGMIITVARKHGLGPWDVYLVEGVNSFDQLFQFELWSGCYFYEAEQKRVFFVPDENFRPGWATDPRVAFQKSSGNSYHAETDGKPYWDVARVKAALEQLPSY